MARRMAQLAQSALTCCAIGGTEIGARVEAREYGIERGVALNVVEEPGVLNFYGDGQVRRDGGDRNRRRV